MALPQAQSDAEFIATAKALEKPVNIAYGLLETVAGSMLFVASWGLAGAAVFDGVRRIYRQAPENLKNFISVSLRGKEQLPKKNDAPRSSLSHAADIALSSGVMMAGMLFLIGNAFAALLLAILTGSSLLTLPVIAGAVLLAGSAASMTKRLFSCLNEKMLFKMKAQEWVVPLRPGSLSLLGKKAVTAFNRVVHSKKEGMAAKPLSPAVQPPAL